MVNPCYWPRNIVLGYIFLSIGEDGGYHPRGQNAMVKFFGMSSQGFFKHLYSGVPNMGWEKVIFFNTTYLIHNSWINTHNKYTLTDFQDFRAPPAQFVIYHVQVLSVNNFMESSRSLSRSMSYMNIHK